MSVSGGRLIRRVAPKYPKAARRAGLQGIVRLTATIAADGTLKDVIIIEGDPTLAAAAADAVKRWRYEPYKLNDAIIEVSSTIIVNFTLDGRIQIASDTAGPFPKDPNAARATVASEMSDNTLPYPVFEPGSDIKPPKAIFAPEPTYAESARKAKTQGNVVLGIIVTPEGETRDIEICKRLDPALDHNAVAAVARWKSTPRSRTESRQQCISALTLTFVRTEIFSRPEGPCENSSSYLS